MTAAHYTAQLVRNKTVIAVVDLDDGSTSVTNDAENVVAKLGETFGLAGRRIIYRDTLGMWDELEHDGKRFTRFAPIRERNLWEAVAKLGEVSP